MQLIRTVAELRAVIKSWKTGGARVALVPTMGAIHAGHLAIVREARQRAEHVVVSLFVNPRQFGAGEDLARYPRHERRDAELLEQAGCAVLFAPSIEEMYPAGAATTVSVAGISDILEGAVRPGHFDGVATVVAKLLLQATPDVALFGEKDYQQLVLIRRMAADLDLPVEIAGVPIVRDDHGLALSSRNAYLTPDELGRARALPRALGEAAAAITSGATVPAVLATARARLIEAGFGAVDYVAFVDAATLAPLDAASAPARLLAAARIGATRLIDNLAIPPARALD